MLQVGAIKIHVINDCIHTVDPGGTYGLVPKALWSRTITPDEDGMITHAFVCLLVEVGDKKIIVDTGYGDKHTDKQRQLFKVKNEGGLLRGLDALGIQPDDIDTVIDTHLHGDHCSGNTRFIDDELQEVEAVFPNAEYVVQRREYQDAMNPNERTRATYFPTNYQPLVKSGQMRLLEGDSELASGVYGVVTPGHTPAHMSVRFESGGKQVMFVCDMATHAVHFERLGWMTAFDVEPLVTLETKRFWQQWAVDTGATIIFPHDLYRPVCTLTLNERDKPQLQPIDESIFNIEPNN